MVLKKLQIDTQIERLFDIVSMLEEQSIEPGHASDALDVLGEVPPFLRALLVADGTVTMALEAYFHEPVVINTLRQGPFKSPVTIPALAMKPGEQCLFREVELIGESSGTKYAHASSVINTHAISPGLFEQLVDEHEGIGVVLRNVARGSFRAVLKVNRGSVFTNAGIPHLNRTYRVSFNSRPAILITEEFPIDVYTPA
jgi:chorismate-pyruvate lyase